MNAASENRLKKVHPELARRVRLLIFALAQKGMQIEVVQGLRTFAEQDALYAQGRTKPGKKVTNARGGQSNHNFGLAVDLCPFVADEPDWKAPISVWLEIGIEAEKQGLEWGGRWTNPVDKPHVQMSSLSIAACLRLYKQGGLNAVWAEATSLLKGL